MFDIFYIGNNDDLCENLPLARQVESIADIKTNTKMYWLIDSDTEILDFSIFEYRPSSYDQSYVHIWKYNEKNFGGITLVPKGKSTGTKEIEEVVCKKVYGKLYTKTPGKYFQKNPKATHVWCIDPEYKLSDNIDWTPGNFEPTFIHCFHLANQLQHKYPEKEGGIKLYPKDWKKAKTKYHGTLDVFGGYPIIRQLEPGTYFDDNPNENYVWCADPEYEFVGKITWVPTVFDQQYVHVFKIKDQLEYKYPLDVEIPWDNRCGGVKLYPRDYDPKKTKYQHILEPSFPVFKTLNPDNVETDADFFWCIDPEYQLDKMPAWLPVHEKELIHVFKIKDQLEHKYPLDITVPWDERCGGVRLYPNAWKNAESKFQGELLAGLKAYPIIKTENVDDYTQRDSFNEDYVWIIDEEYLIDEQAIDYIPSAFEKNQIHTFHLGTQLQHKYPEEMGGIRLVPKDWKDAEVHIHKDSLFKNIKYPIIYTQTVDDYSQRESYSNDYVWIIDEEYLIDEQAIDYIPSSFEKNQIHTFHLGNQLRHKYPEEMGGIRLVPKDWKSSELNIHVQPLNKEVVWEKFKTEEEGRENSTHSWFWVIDENVDVLADFDWGFQPNVFDKNTHVWQKLNPITGRQYDYSGISLCPKDDPSKGRPKYMREPASTQHEYPVYYLAPSDYDKPLQRAYERLSHETYTDMFWVVDVHTQISEEFAFDYYPTHWDTQNIHVFSDANGESKGVRLVPKEMFLNRKYTDIEIANNSFDDLKLINNVASTRPVWPVIDLARVEKDEFVNAMKEAETPFVWTTDSDIKVDQDVLANGFMPNITDLKKVHCWQKLNPVTGQVNSYGGLRLWPTAEDYSKLTAQSLKLNRLRNLQYVKVPGSTIIPYSIVLITYNDPRATDKWKALKERYGDIYWVNNVDGIFEAHKEAAKIAKTDLFWVIDGDAEVMEAFDFSYIPDTYDKEVVHVWSSKNPVNNLEYGYGGIKLFPTQMVRDASSWGLDFTTGLSTRFKAIPEVSCVTAFNTSELETWRSAFRECVKLAVSQDQDAPSRLAAWLSPNADADFASFAKIGAEQGKAFGIQHKQDIEQLNNINNYNWLEKRFKECKK